MKTIIQTIAIYIGIAAGGWMFHGYVAKDIQDRVSGGYSQDQGKALEAQISSLNSRQSAIETRLDGRLNTIEADIKTILIKIGNRYGSNYP